MDLNFTTKSQEALSAAVRDAGAHGNAHVEPAHLLAALLGQTDGIAVALLNGLDVDLIDLRAAVEQAVNSIPSATGASVAPPEKSIDSLPLDVPPPEKSMPPPALEPVLYLFAVSS